MLKLLGRVRVSHPHKDMRGYHAETRSRSAGLVHPVVVLRPPVRVSDGTTLHLSARRSTGYHCLSMRQKYKLRVYLREIHNVPWCKSMSKITIRLIPCFRCAWAAATATLLTKQKPDGLSSPQWWPGGLIATKARSTFFKATASTASHTVPKAPSIAFSDSGHTDGKREMPQSH